MKNGFVNKDTPLSEIKYKMDRIEKNAIKTVFRRDVIQSKKQSLEDKIAAINRHMRYVGYNEPFKK